MFAVADHSPSISFEFFPPKSDKMEENLWRSIERLAPMQPTFVSVTYGAGGSTRERTHHTISRILNETDLTPAAHLTCMRVTPGPAVCVMLRQSDLPLQAQMTSSQAASTTGPRRQVAARVPIGAARSPTRYRC